MTVRVGMMLGDPGGIGAELTAKVLSAMDDPDDVGVVVVADPVHLEAGRKVADVALATEPVAGANDVAVTAGTIQVLAQPLKGGAAYPSGESRSEGGRYMLSCFETLLSLYREDRIDCICFAPLNKHALKLGGMTHADESHWIAEQLAFHGHVAELNVTEGLWTSRVTSHVAIREVADLITEEGVQDAIELIDGTLKRAGKENPRIMVAGLNPHAGDNGSFGREELDIIGPAVEAASKRGFLAEGPFSPDTMFLTARREGFDAIVTMYHDQGQIAMKLMDFEHGVTVLGSLPVPIATPAQGSAYDIAGKGVANSGAMSAAFAIARRMGATTA